MSTTAGEFFLRQATEFGVAAPPILNGEPMVLIDPRKRLSIHVADSIDHQGLPHEIERATREQVVAISEYLMQIADLAYPDVGSVRAGGGPLRSGGYPARGFLGAFTPAQKRLKTGHLRNFIAEVVAPEEIPQDAHEDLLRQIVGYKGHLKRHLTDYRAYLLTTAELHSRTCIGRLGNVSCIAVVRHGEATDSASFSRISRPPLAVSRPLSTNDMLAVMALQESRAVAHEIESQAVRRPYGGGFIH